MRHHIPSESIANFQAEGFMVLESVIDEDSLRMLREECAYFVGYMDAFLDERGLTTLGITHRGKRYFIGMQYRASRRLAEFLYGSLMRSICTSVLGNTSYLFNEQWVVKGAEQGMKFAWHQDSGYVKFSDPQTQHRPYVSCWCALDDMSAENGTISVMPHSALGTENRILDHFREDGTNDLVGYDGDNPGVEIQMPAGSVAVFSSTSLHRSSANTTQNPRRVYLAQYSAEPIKSSTGQLWGQAVPFVRDGGYAYDIEADLKKPRRRVGARRRQSETRESSKANSS